MRSAFVQSAFVLVSGIKIRARAHGHVSRRRPRKRRRTSPAHTYLLHLPYPASYYLAQANSLVSLIKL